MVCLGFKPRTTGVEGWKEGADASTEPWWPPQTELDNFEQFDRRRCRCRMPNAECRRVMMAKLKLTKFEARYYVLAC